DTRAYYPIVAISPAIFFVTIMSTFRGYFEGQQKMLPTALSQIFEQLARVVVSLALVLFFIKNSLELAAAGATFGAAAGAIAGLLALLVIYFRERKSFDQNIQDQDFFARQSSWSIALSIFSLSIPITLSHLVMPVISLIDLTVVPMRLAAAGFDKASRMALYGQLTGMAAPLIHIPQIITIALAVSLVPAISEALALNNRDLVRYRTFLAVRLSLLLGLPAAAGLSILAEPVSLLLYKNAAAGKPLTILAYAVIFIALFQVTSGILQGMGKTQLPLLHLLLGSAVKVVLNWILIGIPSLNIQGAAAASVAGFALASLLNLYRVKETTGLKLDLSKFLLRPLFAVAFMSLAVHLWYYFSMLFLTGTLVSLSFENANTAATLSAIGAGMLLYFLALLITGGVDREDLLTIPRAGQKILSLAEKLGFLKH
ncbi:MAG TPA: polysaccharide biosynthesis protein, partial [Firmicutes bacterium]|nr:polysaccharide biosynthesis protein [Bacillota bacterium]